jgi:hypothetical protein
VRSSSKNAAAKSPDREQQDQERNCAARDHPKRIDRGVDKIRGRRWLGFAWRLRGLKVEGVLELFGNTVIVSVTHDCSSTFRRSGAWKIIGALAKYTNEEYSWIESKISI